jgi:pyrroline-5-carboxylate reductase
MDNPETKLVVLGGGNMGGALLRGLVHGGAYGAHEVLVVEPVSARADAITSELGVPVVPVSDGVEASEAIIAVMPSDVEAVCRTISGVQRVLSVAAGVTIASIERWLSSADRALPVVLRSMPNTGSSVGFGASGLSGGSNVRPADIEWGLRILRAVGIAEVVPERELDAVTGIAGSGIAYLFLVAEAMVEGGVQQGLSREVAVRLCAQTIRGAGQMLVGEGADAAGLRRAVTTSGGTTAAGLRALEDRATRAAFMDAVAAATSRARELGAS